MFSRTCERLFSRKRSCCGLFYLDQIRVCLCGAVRQIIFASVCPQLCFEKRWCDDGVLVRVYAAQMSGKGKDKSKTQQKQEAAAAAVAKTTGEESKKSVSLCARPIDLVFLLWFFNFWFTVTTRGLRYAVLRYPS